MYLPFIVLFIPYWAGLLSRGGVLGLGHILMLAAMLGVRVRTAETNMGETTGPTPAQASTRAVIWRGRRSAGGPPLHR